MNNAKITIRNQRAQAHSNCPQRKSPDTEMERHPDTWIYPSSANFVHPHVRRPPASPRKRRIYADYRELLAFESQARKLNFLGPDGARSLLPERQPQLHERALNLPEKNGETAPDGPVNQSVPFEPTVFEPVEQSAVLIVDQRMNMFFGSRRNLKSVVAANVAALVAWQILAQKKHLSAVIFNDRKMVQFSPGCSRLHTLLILQAVLNQNHSLLQNDEAFSNAGMLNDALRRVSKRATGNTLVFLITDASGCDQETLRLATNISDQSDLLVALIYDPEQAEFCSPSRFFKDDSLSKIDIRKRVRLLREKNQSPAERQRFLAGRLFPDGIPVIPLNTRDDVTYQLRRAFTKSAFSSFTKHRQWPSGFSSPEAQL
jgi:hypothetical protein